MGTTFINLQLKIRMEELVNRGLPTEYVCEQTAEEWTSIFEANREFKWEKICQLGKKLSKELDVPVIAVCYFDDDEFSMNLISKGKMAAFYSAGMKGNVCRAPVKWTENLELSKEEASAFRYLTKKEMVAGESIFVFSRLFGIRMYCDILLWKEDKLDGLWKKDAENVIREIAEEKQRTKVKNKAKAALLCESSGVFVSLDETTQILKMVYPDGENDFVYRHVHCLKINDDGFEEIHDFWYPEDIFTKDSKALHMNYEIGEIHIDDMEGCTEMYPLKLYEKRLLSLMQIPEDRMPEKRELAAVYPLYSQVVDEGRFEYFLRNGTFKSNDELRKVDLAASGKQFAQKNIVSVYQYEEPDTPDAFWSCDCKIPVITADCIVSLRVQYVRKPGTTLCDVRFFNKELVLQRKEVIDLKIDMNQISVNCSFTYCEENDSIYLGNQKIDLGTGEIITGIPELKEADRLFIHFNTRKEGFLFAIKGSSLYVLDLNMKLLSRHRLKGRILYFFTNGNRNVSLITIGSDILTWGKPEKKSAVRLYEIVI